MHIAFWSPVSERVKDYVTGNRAAKALSAQYTYFMVTHPGFAPELLDGYKVTPISAPSDSMWEKARTIIKHVCDNTDVDVLIRVDIDAIVFKPTLLMELADRAYRSNAVIGNPGLARGTVLRGGCIVAARTALAALPLSPDSNVADASREMRKSHDLPFSVELIRAGVTVINQYVFEENIAYTGRRAVWHPQKADTRYSKIHQFNKNMKLFPLGQPCQYTL